ncbi:MAG: hypothetical protein HYY09_03345 [Firmicutes bacterium]|nr:hypothetical protein [Bacillota bacterium]
MPELLVLVNPLSGRGRALEIGKAATAELIRLGVACRTVISPDLQALKAVAAAAVAEAAAATLTNAAAPAPPRGERGGVAVVGGDGTIREIGAVLLSTGIPLGVIPAGTGNGFARSLGLPRRVRGACKVIATGSSGDVDAALAHFAPLPDEPAGADMDAAVSPFTRPFFNVMGAGLDTLVAERVKTYSRLRGLPAFVVGTAALYSATPPWRFRITWGSSELELSGLVAATANGSYYGKGFQIVPGADPRDSRLDLGIIPPLRLIRLAAALPYFFSGGKWGGSPLTIAREIEKVRIESTPPAPVHADGDPVGQTPVEISVLPGAIRVFLPSLDC